MSVFGEMESEKVQGSNTWQKVQECMSPSTHHLIPTPFITFTHPLICFVPIQLIECHHAHR